MRLAEKRQIFVAATKTIDALSWGLFFGLAIIISTQQRDFDHTCNTLNWVNLMRMFHEKMLGHSQRGSLYGFV